MLKYVPVFLFSIIISISAQFELKCEYLINPEKAIPYVDSCAQFWKSVYDETRGGFYTNVDKFGNVQSWSRDKNTLTQTRNAYGYARAYQLTGNDEYLEYAAGALNFMYDNAWDEQYTGWFSVVDEYGNPQMAGNKSAFDAHYAILGIITYYEATGDTLALQWLNRSLEFNENSLWDSREEYFGYYDYVSRTTMIKNNKSFNATVDAITTHLLYMYLLTEDNKYLVRLEQMADNILNHLVASMDNQAIGFAEHYDREWNINEGETNTLMGHVLKTGWCMNRINYYAPNQLYRDAAETLVNEVLEKGYDHEYGGPYKDYNRVTGEMLLWGQPDSGKAWWQMEQAVTAGLQLYDTFGDEKYLRMADESLDFFMKHFVDHEYGEVYFDRTRYGDQLWSENKGDGYKAAYHSIETGYYTYLYGNLFVHKKPVKLFYNYAPVDFERTVNLSPIAMRDEMLVVDSVMLDGKYYSNFDGVDRVLTIPAGTGGEFEVFYGVPGATSVVENEALPSEFDLAQNYPNPFNPETNINFSIPEAGNVKLSVFNVLGEEVAVLFDGFANAGTQSIRFNAEHLGSGVYIYTLQTNNSVASRKMMLMK